MKLKNILLCLLLINITFSIPYADIIAKSYSISGLALVVPHAFIFKTNFRGLQFIQLCYLYTQISNISFFSDNLNFAWISFMPSFYGSLCQSYQFTCLYGFALSFGSVLTGLLILLFLIVTIEACRKSSVRFLPVYSVFKGFIRWFYIILCCGSISTIINYLQNNISGFMKNFIAPIIILCLCVVFPISQLIIHKRIQKEDQDVKLKWAQFFEYLRILIISALIQIYLYINTYAEIGVYIIIVLYFIGTIIFQKFDSLFQKIIFTLNEAANITLFSLFVFAPEKLSQLELDFYIITAMFGIQFFYQFFKYFLFLKNAKSQVKPLQKKQVSLNNSVDTFETSVQKLNKFLVPITSSKRYENSTLKNAFQETLKNQNTEIQSKSIKKNELTSFPSIRTRKI